MHFSPLPTPRPDDLRSLARAAGAELAPVAGGALLRVHHLGPGRGALSWRPLDGLHPLEVLMGFVAPPDWRAVGVCTAGLAHRPGGTAPVRITLLVDRGGASASVLHHDDGAVGDEVLPGRTEGVVADACRRALGLPTRPPPPSSLPLWTATWLDRVVTAATGREPGRPELSWAAVARLHPASTGPADPIALALAAAALAEAWPWHRLRAEPSVADVVGAVPDAAVAAWMDDGMWARRVAEGLAPIADLLDATRVLLAPAVADAVDLVAAAGADASAGWSDVTPEGGL
jgi:hypothetical protein